MATRLTFGLIGTGYMGRAHAIALHAIGPIFPEVGPPICELLADSQPERARRGAQALGFRRAAADWRELVTDPAVDVVDICTPNHLHHEMALAALAAGKHVYCEKPLALTAAQAAEVAAAARNAGVQHVVGFNYICNPLIRAARELIRAGEIGAVTAFHGEYHEDYMSDPDVPYSWRCERRLAGSGALADLGSHLINMAHFLVGDIARVCGSLCTVHERRLQRTGAAQGVDTSHGRASGAPSAASEGTWRKVENEDVAHALLEFAAGPTGTMSVSRVATGRKCGLTWRIFGTRGSLAFDQERMNELQLYAAGDEGGRRGYRTVLAGPEHPDYARFCPAPGHGLGINDLKTIELRNLILAIEQGTPAAPDFVEGWRVQQVMEAIDESHSSRSWVNVRQADGGQDVGRADVAEADRPSRQLEAAAQRRDA